MAEIVKPHRRFQLELHLGAGNIDALVAELKEITRNIQDGTTSSISGGCDAGYWFKITEDKDMTQERYTKELHEYLAKIDRKLEEDTGIGDDGERTTGAKT